MTETPLTSRTRRTFQNLAVLAIALIVALLLVEIGFRMAVWFQPDAEKRRIEEPVVRMGDIVQLSENPDLVYEYRPNIDTAKYPNFSNAAGMRGPDRPLEKPPHTIRIAGIGDSVMAGDLYPYEQTFLFVLEDLLNEAASTSPTRFEVLNFAVGGYNIIQEAIAFREKVLSYDPDWAILGVVVNDWEPPVFFRTQGDGGGEQLRDRYQLESRLRYGTGLNPEDLPWWAHSVAARWVRSRFYWNQRLKVFRRGFVEIAETARENDIRLLAVILTEDVAVDQAEDPREEWHEVVREIARQENVPVLDLYPLIKTHLEEAGISSYEHYWSGPQDPHANVAGHRLIARLVFKRLVEMGILESRPPVE